MVAPLLPVILVNGTHGMGRKADWDNPTSAFVSMLSKYGMGIANPLRPYVWTTNIDGDSPNDPHWDWAAAGINLYAYISPPLFPNDRLGQVNTRIVAHSHGLQAVLYAAAAGLKVGSLVSVGSPVRKDMLEIATNARPNINRWLHLSAEGDWMQVFGEMFDGSFGVRREHPLADKNDKMPRDAGHGGILRDPRYFPLWQSRAWALWLRNTRPPNP
jgi:hypothetical protein